MRSRALDRFTELIRRPRLFFRRFGLLFKAKMVAKRALAKTSKAVWRVPLDRERTIRMLEGHEIQVARDGMFALPERKPAAGARPPTFGRTEIMFEPEYVWRIERNEKIRSMRIASSGTIVLNGRFLLDTDFGSLPGIADRPLKRRRIDIDIAIVPWSHKWATYYEFLIHILSKLCRMKEAIDPLSWAAAKVCYPLLNAPFEDQYLSLLGLSQGAVLNTRENTDLVAHSVVISNLQRDHRLPSPTGLAALRRAFLGEAGQFKNDGRRLYLSRGGWKRQVLNETEVRRLVSSYGLEVVESIPATVDEQIRMFGEASLVVSPHGSSLANLVWCTPGTRVIELFTRSYTPPMYAYISFALGLRYGYLVDNAPGPHRSTSMHKDLVVDVKALANALKDT